MVNREQIYEFFMSGLAEFCCNAIILSLSCAGSIHSYMFINSALQIGFCFGIMVMASYNTFWMISGAFITPPITIAGLIVGKIDWKHALIYIPCQFLGAFFGYGLAMLLVPEVARFSDHNLQPFCTTTPNEQMNITNWHAFGIEFIVTSGWIFVMMAVWSRKSETIKDISSLQIGLAVIVFTIISVESTGASMSPARTLAPAVLQGVYDGIWVYMTAPLLAPLFVAPLWKYFFEIHSLKDFKKGSDATQNDA